ncbi:MAG TPA: HEAT repeat domain-containing protein [Chitinophagaceae bacterium]|nr:HEAT repeat domain-containing protein [Chitinophagaceae bacterium]
MDYTEINRCIQVLNERPKWFIQKENVVDKLQCFDTLQKLGTPSTIYSLIAFLRNDNILIQTKAAETILHLFGKLRSLNESADILKHLPVKNENLDFYKIDFDEKTYAGLLSIASLNSNGYVREKAVKELARLKNPEGIKFILFRLGDWVSAVRKAATEAIASFLDTTHVADLVKQLPTIGWLLKVERVDLNEIYSRIIQFILSQEFSDEFYAKINSLDDKTRFRYYKIFLANTNPTKGQINKISHDKNFLVRLELIKHISVFETDVQKELIEAFLADQFARVRLEALYASKRFIGKFNEQIIMLLSDEAASVRELSRLLLKDKGIDLAVLYRQRITNKQFLSGSLLGLSETTNSEDLPIFEQYISSEKSKLVIACLTAINKFNEDKAKQYSLELLIHTTKRVRDKAVEILAKNTDNKILEGVRDIYAKGSHDIKKTILKLYNKIGGWKIIADLLLALTDENIIIQDQGWQFLYKWKVKATTLFTTPPKAEIERVNRIYSSLNTSNLKMTHSRTNLLQDLKFFLR